jgi:hypothetical protein
MNNRDFAPGNVGEPLLEHHDGAIEDLLERVEV